MKLSLMIILIFSALGLTGCVGVSSSVPEVKASSVSKLSAKDVIVEFWRRSRLKMSPEIEDLIAAKPDSYSIRCLEAPEREKSKNIVLTGDTADPNSKALEAGSGTEVIEAISRMIFANRIDWDDVAIEESFIYEKEAVITVTFPLCKSCSSRGRDIYFLYQTTDGWRIFSIGSEDQLSNHNYAKPRPNCQ